MVGSFFVILLIMHSEKKSELNIPSAMKSSFSGQLHFIVIERTLIKFVY